MRFLANKNFPGGRLKPCGNRVMTFPGFGTNPQALMNQTVIRKAIAEDRILLTFDKDFGELVFRSGYKVAGVILFRTSMPSAEYIARIAQVAIDSRSDWAGYFSVIEDKRIRMTPLPVSD